MCMWLDRWLCEIVQTPRLLNIHVKLLKIYITMFMCVYDLI